MTAQIIGYLVVASFVGSFALLVLDDAEWCPTDAHLALSVLCGALWPLTIFAVLGFALWRATCAIAASFAALWRAVCPGRPSVPRAKARRRSS